MVHILIVDDHEDSRHLVEYALKRAGHQVTSAANGAEALAQARQNTPDMIVSDILMPVMDGFTLCRHWRSDENLRHLPFVFYTATYTDPKDEKLAMDLGADRFVVRPQAPEVLAAMVDEVLAAGAGTQHAVATPTPDEEATLREYNEALVRKLEQKLFDLEAARKHADAENAERRQAEGRSRKLIEEMERSRQSLFDIIEEQRAAEQRIQEQLDELARWKTLTVGREDRVLELKREVNELLAEVNQPARYVITDEDGN